MFQTYKILQICDQIISNDPFSLQWISLYNTLQYRQRVALCIFLALMYNFILLNYTCYKFIFGTRTTVNENILVYKTRDYA